MKYPSPAYSTIKKVFILSIILSCFNYTYAQQAPHYAQYLYNMQVINPAFVGSKSDFNAALLTRRQWTGVEGAPETTTFSANTRINSGFGFGGTVILDKIGLVENTNLNLDVSYTIATSQYGRLSFGVKGGLALFENNLADGITPDNDIYASTTGRYGNLGFGFLYHTNKFFAAVSFPNILDSPVFTIQDNIATNVNLENSNYFFTGGMRINLSKFNDVVLQPSTMVRYIPSLPLSVDINTNLIYKKTYEVGLSYRFQNSIGALVAITLNEKFRIGYAYENQLTSISNNLNTHELILRVDLKFEGNKRWLNEDCYCF